jgi:hypothetical protein
MLKNVNTLLKSVGEIRLNSKNRDEVILAISCYGKLLTSSSKKNVSVYVYVYINYLYKETRYEKT